MFDLVVVGAGPKAVALAAKTKVLSDMGVSVPDIVVVDPLGVGANWNASGGWTDGAHRLGTLPEKDCGFPYHCPVFGDKAKDQEVDVRMLEYSWTAFMVQAGEYGWWVDRGRPNPTHNQFTRYLTWVADKAGLRLIRATVDKAELRDEGWVIDTVDAEGNHEELSSRGLMITGPGPSDNRFAEIDGVYSPAGFWSQISTGKTSPTGRVGVIGGGETAASILEELVRHRFGDIQVISPTACLYSRGENQFENQLYSDPTLWAALDGYARRDVLSRTDRGVFSLAVLDAIRADGRVGHIKGLVGSVDPGADGRIAVTIEDVKKGRFVENFDWVIDARGATPMWFTDILGPSVTRKLTSLCGSNDLSAAGLELIIDEDLSVHGLAAQLFLPSLAGFNQGPGFANLSCLGHTSARILSGLRAAKK